jgi:prolyl oligopeptidase
VKATSALLVFFGLSMRAGAPVPTPRHPVTLSYHGVNVTEDYQWLEAATNSAVREWTAKQNEFTQGYLRSLPARNLIAEQLRQMAEESSASYFSVRKRGGRTFGMRFKPPQQQPVLIHFPSVDRLFPRTVILDPNVLSTNGTTAIDWFVPSWDGKRVAVSLSEGGSEDGSLHFFDADNGHAQPDVIRHIQYPTAGGSAAWTTDGKGVFYTRFPRVGERPEADLNFYQQIWFHRLGTPDSEDRYELGKEFPRIAEINLAMQESGGHLLARVANGDGGEIAFWLRDNAAGIWRQISTFADEAKNAEFGKDNALYLLSKKQAPRGKILRLALPNGSLGSATTVVPESQAVIEGFESSATGLYVADLLGGPYQVRFFPRGKSRPALVPLPPVSGAYGLRCWDGDDLFFSYTSYTDPGALLGWRPGEKQTRVTAIRDSSPVNFDDVEVVRESATSKDGTKVPLNILRRKGTRLDGSNPTLLTGYGGYSISLTPYCDTAQRIWLDAGGVFAVANLRGGGEFGEEWHRAGNLTRKQNVFDDFIACAEHLIARRYTSSEKLAVEGGSNGGLLMGAFLTQRPELARAVVSHVGIYDMLRVELDPNGEFNTTEFGSVKDPDQFRALYAYSPLHRVKDSANYPAVLLAAGDNDGRVNPAHSRKMTARLQAANASAHPIYLRTTAASGHGIGTSFSEAIQLQADVYAFLFDQLGMSFGAAAMR